MGKDVAQRNGVIEVAQERWQTKLVEVMQASVKHNAVAT